MYDFTRPFMEQAMNCEVMDDEIEEFIERWHEGGTGTSLHDYLGMSWDEYSLWGMDPDSLPIIITARRANKTVAEAANDNFQDLRLAARSDQTTKIAALHAWLESRGYLS